MMVYEKIREYITANGYKQVAVAQKAGISSKRFNALMNGRRKLYSDDLYAICIALNISPEMFVETTNYCIVPPIKQ